MQRQVRMFALLFFIFSNLSCATRNRDDSPPGRKVVVAINLDAPLLKMIPRDFLVLYVYPSFRTETVENDLSRRAGSESQDDVSCYVNSDADKILGESKLCFQKFLTEFGHIDYVVPRGDEENVYLAGKLRSAFSITNGLDETHASFVTDKLAMKRQLTRADPSIKTAKFIEVTANDVRKSFPNDMSKILDKEFGKNWQKVVLKPASAAGSAGVHVLQNGSNLLEDLRLKYTEDIADSLKLGHLIVEEFVDGRILRTDGFVRDGKLEVNFVSAYRIPPKDFYRKGDPQLTISISNPEEKKMFDEFTQKVVTALDYKSTGIIHLEIIQHPKEGLYFLEMAARTGGTLFPVLIDLGFDSDLAYVRSNLLLDYTPDLKPAEFAAVSLFVPKDIPLDTSEIWLDTLDHKDMTKCRSCRIDISVAPPPAHSYLDVASNIEIQYFIHRDAEVVVDEATGFYKSLKAKVKLKGGKNDGRWMSLTNQQWF